MKTKITFLKLSLAASFLSLSNLAIASESKTAIAPVATYYTCINTPLTLTAGLPASTTALWDVKKDGATASYADYPKTAAPTSFTEAGSYEIILVSQTNAASGTCSSDPISSTVIVLPPLALNLAMPTNPAYCEGVGAAANSVITASGATLATGLATDLGLEYSYSVSNGTTTYGGTDVVGAGVLGSIDASGNYTLLTKIPGTYVITGTVKYTQLSTNTSNHLLGTGCPFVSTTTRSVTVTAKPGAPTITIVAAP
jgi:hypothetical protein